MYIQTIPKDNSKGSARTLTTRKVSIFWNFTCEP